MSTGEVMTEKAVAEKAPISAANDRSSSTKDNSKSNCEETIRKLAAQKTRLLQDVVMLPDHNNNNNNNNNNDKNNSDLASPSQPSMGLQAQEETSTTDSMSSSSSAAIANKLLASHMQQHPTDKKTIVSAECYESRNDSSGTRSSSTVARFKEKRPEPLKLNPNINQEIPLDLSVKSAGNVPSGIRGCIFNLSNLNQMATLETPRIQWQDNETFLSLSKSRLFSSSTSAGQRARMSIGDSPPITPGTPFMDLITSPSQATTLRSANQQTNISSTFDAQHQSSNHMICSPLELSKYQMLDKITRTNKSLLRYHQLRNEIKGTPRRSCSTDNLDYLCTKVVQNKINQNLDLRTTKETKPKQRQDQDYVTSQGSNLNQPHINDNNPSSKKNAISPLAIKSLSSTNASSETARFSYGNQQIAAMNSNEEQKSPTFARINKAVTPTSVANATANLSNIHLNSPTGNQDSSPTSSLLCDATSLSLDQQISLHQTSNFSSLSELLAANQRSHPEPSPLDPLLSATYCQQNRQPLSINSSSSQGPEDLQNHIARHDSMISSTYSQQHQTTTPSFSSLATLNTPTIISPSQLRAGNICFLPSPTLSPMSSVFDLPSPLLVFPQSAQQTQSNSVSGANKVMTALSPSANSNKDRSATNIQRTTNLEKNNSKSGKTSSNQPSTRTTGANVPNAQQSDNLSHLITPAQKKVGNAELIGSVTNDTNIENNDDEDVGMEVVDDDVDLNVEIPTTTQVSSKDNLEKVRPATTIPQIYVTMGSKFEGPQRAPDRHQWSGSAQNESNWRHIARSNPSCVNQLQASCPLNISSQVSYSSQHIDNTSDNQRNQRDAIDKRAPSPNSLRSRVNLYHNERHGSCSAPPDVNQVRARSKIKTVEAWSYNELSSVQNKEQSSHTHHGTATTLENHNNRLLQQQNESNEASVGQHPEGTNQHLSLYPEVRGGFVPGSVQSTSHIQSNGASFMQLNSYMNVAKPMIEGRSSSAEPPGSYQTKCSRSSFYNVDYGIAMNQLPRDYHGLSHSAQQLRQNGSSCSQTRSWNSALCGSNQSYQYLHHQLQQQSHLMADSNQQSAQQQHSISAGELNSRASQNMGSVSCAQSQQLYPQPSFCKTLGGSQPSSKVQGYGLIYQQSLDSDSARIRNQNYLKSSMNELDNLRNQRQPAAMNANVSLTRDCSDLKRQSAHFSSVANTNAANCGPQRMVTNSMCPSDWTNDNNSAAFCSNVANLNTNNRHLNSGSVNSLNGNSALASMRLCTANSQCQIEAENHSETLDSDSLDFCSLSGPGNGASRSSSAASSNMTAKKYHCDQCSKSFTRSDMLTRHKRLHSGDRPFQCSECKQEFSRSDHLSTHMRTHTGEKPYRCKLCSYSACRKDMITRHMKVHNRSQTSINTLDSM